MATNERNLPVIHQGPIQPALSVEQIKTHIQTIQLVMRDVMQDGQHYGVIPGCGNKPTLLKAGAEKLMATFRLAPKVIVDDVSSIDERRYRVTVELYSGGVFVGAGVGECSSAEEKYAWRKAICDEEFESVPADHKRVKFGKYNNKVSTTQQVRTNAADQANTVLKMAKKRALIDATLTATGASDMFTQDLEEIIHQDGHEPQSKPPQSRPAPKKQEPVAQTEPTVAHTSEGEVLCKLNEVGMPLCPLCESDMWDNRDRKTNPKAPDFKCKQYSKTGCEGVIWPGQLHEEPAEEGFEPEGFEGYDEISF